jgi:cytoskeletal protein CcmA (bactofilin family)
VARVKRFKAPKVATVIGQGTVITGDVTFSGGLHLDGAIRGKVIGEADTQATLTVSELGAVEGDVRVENLILNGTVVGDVRVGERVELANNARVTGTVYYQLLEMAMGAQVNGQLVRVEDEAPGSIGTTEQLRGPAAESTTPPDPDPDPEFKV